MVAPGEVSSGGKEQNFFWGWYGPRGRPRARNVAVHTFAALGRFRVVSTAGNAVFRERCSGRSVLVVFSVVLYKCSSHGTQQRGLGSFALETLVGLWTDDSPEAFLNRAKFLKIYFRVLIQVLIYSGFFLQTYLPAQRVAMII